MKIIATALVIASLFPQANAIGMHSKKNRKLSPCGSVEEQEPAAPVEEKARDSHHNIEFQYKFDLPFDHDVVFSPSEQEHIFEAFQLSFNDLNDPTVSHMDHSPVLKSDVHSIIHKRPSHDGRKLAPYVDSELLRKESVQVIQSLVQDVVSKVKQILRYRRGRITFDDRRALTHKHDDFVADFTDPNFMGFWGRAFCVQ